MPHPLSPEQPSRSITYPVVFSRTAGRCLPPYQGEPAPAIAHPVIRRREDLLTRIVSTPFEPTAEIPR